MAENKKSFVLYVDLIHTVKHLTDEQSGKLFKHILSYCNDENPKTDDVITNLAFEPIKLQLKRDLKKWEQQQQKRSEAGKKGMESRWKNNKAITNDNSVINDITKITDNVTVNVNDINTIVLNIQQIDKWILELKSQQQFLDGLYMTHKLRQNILGKIALLFKEHLKMHPKNHENFVEFRNHFGTWVGFKIKKDELGEYLKHQKGEL